MLLLAPSFAVATVLLADVLQHIALALAACPAAAAARCRRRCCRCHGRMISAARGDAAAAAAISARRISIALCADPLRHGDLRGERPASTTRRRGRGLRGVSGNALRM